MSESNCTLMSEVRLIDLPTIPLDALFKYLGNKPVDEQDRILDLRRNMIKRGFSHENRS